MPSYGYISLHFYCLFSLSLVDKRDKAGDRLVALFFCSIARLIQYAIQASGKSVP